MSASKHEFSDWNDVWAKRAASYNLANAKFPDARKTERDRFVAGLALAPRMTVLEVGAAGGYLSAGIAALLRGEVEILAIESSDSHIGALPNYVRRVDGSSITQFSLGDATVDRVVNLASLHHTLDDRGYFSESLRVLKPGGLVGAADVQIGSPVAKWLDEFVHNHNSRGHVGRFYAEGEFSRRLEEAGFMEIRELVATYTWNFETVDDMCEYCQLLFGLDRADLPEIHRAIEEILGIVTLPDGTVGMRWGLLHAFGRKG
jgi:ubiquinone/menaquinone biosynthesis C-methylase UbiE